MKLIRGDAGSRNDVTVSAVDLSSPGVVATVVLSDDADANRWDIVCSADVHGLGWFVIGRIRTLAPGASFASRNRVLALLYVPGARGYSAEAFRLDADGVPAIPTGRLGMQLDKRASFAARPLTIVPGSARIVVPSGLDTGAPAEFEGEGPGP